MDTESRKQADITDTYAAARETKGDEGRQRETKGEAARTTASPGQ